MHTERGFTILELTIVMIVAGVLAAVAVPRLFSSNDFAVRGARDFVGSALRYAQKSAVAMRRNVCVGIAGSTVSATFATAAGADQACAPSNALAQPANNLPFSDPANALPGGATVAGATSVIFDASGRPLSAPSVALAGALSINVVGASQPVTVEPETGLVR
jgi:MSHA pilin protein MshC